MVAAIEQTCFSQQRDQKRWIETVRHVWTGSAEEFLPLLGRLSVLCLPQLSMLADKHSPVTSFTVSSRGNGCGCFLVQYRPISQRSSLLIDDS